MSALQLVSKLGTRILNPSFVRSEHSLGRSDRRQVGNFMDTHVRERFLCGIKLYIPHRDIFLGIRGFGVVRLRLIKPTEDRGRVALFLPPQRSDSPRGSFEGSGAPNRK